MMTDRPIIFSAPMVRSLLAGTKTQTRRAIKPVGNDEGFVVVERDDKTLWPWRSDDGESMLTTIGGFIHEIPMSCPYGQPGDRLYVKEKHAFLDVRKSALSQFPLVGGGVGHDIWNLCVEYSDGTENDTFSVEGEKPRQTRARGDDGWRPSIYMPRWASRILLEITDVRVERLNDISHEDAMTEGMAWDDAIFDYSRLWERINGDGSWNANPFVWVLSFRRISP